MSVNPAFWPSGRIKHATFVLLLGGNVTIGASSTASITVNQGGSSAPAASSRALSDFSAADLKHTVTILDNGSGTYTSSLNTGVTDANTDNYVWLDGAAGKMWRIREDYRSSGTAHGALQGYFYVMSMQNASGTFGGIQLQFCLSCTGGDITQSLRTWYSFSTCQLYSGTTLIRDNVTNGRSNTGTFTWHGSGSSATWDTGNNYIETAQVARLTTTGTLPTGLSLNTTYFPYVGPYYAPPKTSFTLYTTAAAAVSGAGGSIAGSDNGSGTHTYTIYPWVTYLGRLFACDTNAQWDYIQGGGSVAPLSGTVFTNVQVRFDTAYLRTTLAIPSYDLGATITAKAAMPFYINTIGIYFNLPDSGGYNDDHIGIMPGHYVDYLYTMAQSDEQTVRGTGYLGGQIGGNLRLSLNNYRIPCFNNGHNGTGTQYTGMGRCNYDYRYSDSTNSTVYQPITSDAYANITGQPSGEMSHRLQHFYLPYLITGQPEYLDMLIEAANAPIASGYNPGSTPAVTAINSTTWAPAGTGSTGGSRNVTTTNGSSVTTTRYGIFSLTGSNRQDAWQIAMTGCCAGIIPQNHPECASYWQYFTDIVNDNINFIADCISLLPTYAASVGLFSPQGASAGYYWADIWQWAYNLQAWSMVHGLQVANAYPYLNTMNQWIAHIVNTFGVGNICVEEYLVKTNGASNGPIITSDSQFASYGPNTSSWTSGTADFPINSSWWSPAVGDWIFWTTPDPPSQKTTPTPAAFTTYQPYYVVSVSGTSPNWTIQLSATPGGTAIVNTDSYSGSAISFWAHPASPISTITSNNVTDYPTLVYRSMLMSTTRGATMDATARAAMAAVVPPTSSSLFNTNSPVFCFGA